jgi:hypothetical protein
MSTEKHTLSSSLAEHVIRYTLQQVQCHCVVKTFITTLSRCAAVTATSCSSSCCCFCYCLCVWFRTARIAKCSITVLLRTTCRSMRGFAVSLHCACFMYTYMLYVLSLIHTRCGMCRRACQQQVAVVKHHHHH